MQTFFGPPLDGSAPIYGFAAVFQNLGATRTGPATGWGSIAYFHGAVPYNTDFSNPHDAVEPKPEIVGPNGQLVIPPVVL